MPKTQMRQEIEIMRTWCEKQLAIPDQSSTMLARFEGFLQALDWVLELSDKLEGGEYDPT